MDIIRLRLAKALRLNSKNSVYAQYRNPERKRKAGSKKGMRTLTKHLSIMMTPEGLQALDELCDRYTVQRGVVIRDALDFYLGMAAQEAREVGPLRGIDALPTPLAVGKIRRPDGVVINAIEVSPGARLGQ